MPDQTFEYKANEEQRAAVLMLWSQGTCADTSVCSAVYLATDGSNAQGSPEWLT